MSSKDYNTIVVYNRKYVKEENSILERFNEDLIEKLLEFLSLTERVSLTITKKAINSLVSTFPYDTTSSGLIHTQLPMVKLSGVYVGFYNGLGLVRHNLTNLKKLSFATYPKTITNGLNIFTDCDKLEDLTLRVNFEPYRQEYFPYSYNIKKLTLAHDIGDVNGLLKHFPNLKELSIKCMYKYEILDLSYCIKLKKLTIKNAVYNFNLILSEDNEIESLVIKESNIVDQSFILKMKYLTDLYLQGIYVGDISGLTNLKRLHLCHISSFSDIYAGKPNMPPNLEYLIIEGNNSECVSLLFINGCKKLRKLKLTFPRSDTNLANLETFSYIKELDLGLKNLSYIPFDKFPSLISLSIRTQSKTLLNNIAEDFPLLENLLIYNCCLQDLSCIRNSKSLKLLEIWDRDYIPLDEITTCPNLKSLRLNNCDPLSIKYLSSIEKTTVCDRSSKINATINHISRRSDINVVSFY